MGLVRYFVFSRSGEWIVMLDGNAIARYGSRESAVDGAIIMADLMGSMQHDSDVVIEDDGRLGLAWTFGIDPLRLQDGELH